MIEIDHIFASESEAEGFTGYLTSVPWFVWLIAGIALVIVIFLIALLVILRRRKRKKKAAGAAGTEKREKKKKRRKGKKAADGGGNVASSGGKDAEGRNASDAGALSADGNASGSETAAAEGGYPVTERFDDLSGGVSGNAAGGTQGANGAQTGGQATDRQAMGSRTSSAARLSLAVEKVHSQGTREYQEDSFSVSPEGMYPQLGLLAVICDGMGGLFNGDKVSQTAVMAMMNGFYQMQGRGEGEQVLLNLLYGANGAVNQMLGLNNIGKCGSTMVAGLIREDRLYYLSVGDSRICLYRDGVLYQLNREHIYRNELAQRAINGDGTIVGAWSHPKASGLTSFLGMGQIKYLDIPAAPADLKAGDTVILMTDGVYNALSNAEICQTISRGGNAGENLDAAVKAKAWPGQDNYTAVVIRVS